MAKATLSEKVDKECLRLSKPKVKVNSKLTKLTLEDALRAIVKDHVEIARKAEVAAKCWNGLVENGWNINYFPNLEGDMKWQVVKYHVNNVFGWEVIATGEIPEQAMFRALSLTEEIKRKL
jgi:hypothetical protein